MIRRGLPVILAALWFASLASPVAAAPGAAPPRWDAADADHIGGSFDACGRIVAFTAPIVGTPGSLTVAGVLDGADHVFPIAETAFVDPLVAPLAAAGEWTCLEMVGDGMGVITSIAVASTSSCGALTLDGSTFVQQPNVTHPFTTVTLDGDAGTMLAADADLLAMLEGIATVAGAELACFDFILAADGTLSSVLVDYAGIVACGMVNGTQVPYRDPASQPFPDGPTVSVAGFSLDASLFAAPHLEVLAFHLDAVAEVCLFVEVTDSVIVRAAARGFAETEVCGELEVVGGLVFVDTVVISQGLTGVNFAEPASASIALACWSARALPSGVNGLALICGDFESATDTTFTVSDVTFHLETSIDDSDLPPVGGPQAIAVIGPDPFEPFGPGNPTRVTTATMTGCAGGPTTSPLPDTSTSLTGGSAPVALVTLLAVLWFSGAIGLAVARARRI